MGPNDSTVAFLPSAHIAQRVVIELLPMRCGMPVTFSRACLLPNDIRKVRPTIPLAPRMGADLLHHLHRAAQEARRDSQGLYGALGWRCRGAPPPRG